ncbi:MAG: DUF2341 domain-containing protein [Planctomycetaceae bacterium]
MKRTNRKLGNRVQLVVDEVLHLLGHSSSSGADSARGRRLQLTRLEERVLMSASPIAVVAELATIATETAFADSTLNNPESDAADLSTAESPMQSTANVDGGLDTSAADTTSGVQGVELIVIDSRVQDPDTLLSQLLNTDRDFRILRLDAVNDGLAQITEKLEQLEQVSAIHLLTHGNTGEILLGSTVLNANTLAQHAPELFAWQHNLTANADLLLYGCDVAATTEGRDFVESLHKLTGADLAASIDETGHEGFGGNWDLEYTTGVIETSGAFTQNVQQNWLGKLASINVTTFDDTVDGNTTSVANLLANKGTDNAISLREAILAINAGAGGDTINLAAGTYTLSRTGTGEDLASTGDLDILKNVTIIGTGSGTTTINANGIDRAFDIRGSSGQLTLSGVTVQGGNAGGSSGGGFSVETATNSLTLSNVVVQGNSASAGAGIDNAGTLVLTDVTIQNNGNLTTTTQGGGLRNTANATLNRVTVSGNRADLGGGIYNNFGTGNSITLTNVTLSGNSAQSSGGGIYTRDNITVVNSTITLNESDTGGGIRTQSGTVNLQNTIVAGNIATSANPDLQGTYVSSGSNLIGDGTGQSGLINNVNGDKVGTGAAPINPLLGALQSNGGSTLTHALLAGSTAINAGTAPGAPTADQRGISRVGLVDIGAYEFAPTLTPTGELAVNVTTGQTQETSGQTRGSTKAVSITPSGNYVVVWTSNQSTGLDAHGRGVLMRVFRPDGTPLTGEIQVNQTFNSDQQWATVATDDAGNGVVVWTSTGQDSGSTTGVYARRFNAAGALVGNEFLVNTTTTGAQESAAAAMSGSGSFVVTWSGKGTGDTAGIFYRRFDASGTPLDLTERLANGTDRGTELAPSIAINDAGQFAIAWHVGNDLYTRNFAANGTAVTADIQVDNGLANAYGSAVGIDALGRTVVVYRTDGLLSVGSGVWARAFNADGTEWHTWISIASGTGTDQTSPSIGMDDAGNFIVTYQSSGDSNGDAVYVRRYNSDFSAAGTAQQVNVTTAGNQQMASVAMLDLNNYVVVWSGQGPGDNDGVFARQFSSLSTAPTALALSAVADTYIDKGATGTNYGVATSLVVDRSGGDIGNQRALLKFDLSTLPAGTVILSASLQMHATQNSGAFNINVYELTENWVEGNVNGTASVASWTQRQTGTNWTTAGGTYDPTVVATLNTGATGQHNWDITSLVTAWQSGEKVNNGIIIGSPDTGTTTIVYDSREGTTPPVLQLSVLLPDTAPVITSNGGGATALINLAENTTSVTTVTATDADLPAQTLSYSINGGADASKFAINPSTGMLSFITAPDFESPTDAGANNIYEVLVQVSDGTLTDTQAISVTVTNVNDTPPVVTGGQSFSVSETATVGTALGTVTATDTDGATTYGNWQITAGNVDGVFAIDASSGLLTIANPANLNFDITPSYVLSVTVSDGVNTSAVQSVSITVLDSPNMAPVATNDNYTVSEGGTLNQTVVSNWFNPNWQYRQQLVLDNSASSTNLVDAAVLVKLHTSAVDAIHIDYAATQNAGEDLRFVDTNGTVLAYEIEQWNETGYSYVWVRVPQIDAGSTTDSIYMYYGNATATSGQSPSAVWSANDVAIFHMNSNSVDSTSYGNSGASTSVFAATGVVAGAGTFDGLNSSINAFSATSVDNLFAGGGAISAWINPVSWGEGGYGRIADKGTTTSGTLGWGFQVAGTNSSDGYLIFESDFTTNVGRWRTTAGSVAQNTWQNVVVVYDNSSTANVPKIYINGVQAAITQMSAPSGTARSDAAQDLYIGNRSGASDRTFSGRMDEIRFSSAASTADQVKADYKSVTGTLVSSSGVIAGPGGLLENDSDPDNNNLTVSLVSGPSHAASFSLNPDGSFNYVHDGSETTTDSFTYRVSDGTLTDTATVVLTITPVNDNTPVITSNGGGATAAISVAENTTAVTTVTATDADLPAQTLTYSISGGADAAKFSINSTTGVLTFVTAPNFEAPTDNGTNNVYNVNVQVTDGTLTDTQAITITVTDVNESPSMTVNQTVFTIPEDASTSPPIEIATIAINDDALGSNSLTLTGADASSFQIVAGNKLRLKANTVLNADTQPLFTVTINLSDPTLSGSPISSQTVTLSISNIDEPPTADAGGPYVIAEGESLTVTAGPSVDPEGLPLTYAWDIDGDGQFDDATGAVATLTWEQLGGLTIPVNDNMLRTVALRVTDAGGNSTAATASLTVNNTPPAVMITGNANATSGTPYSINIASSDPGNDTITSWRINWGDGTIQTVAGTSSTATHTYTVPGGTRLITLTATDEDGTHNMTGSPLVVTLANSPPTAPNLSDLVVPGLINGANVGTLSFTDPDAGDSHTWTVSDSRFTVVGSTLKLKPSQQINPATEPTVTLTVTVTDAGGLSNASVFVLRINNPPISVADMYAVDATQQLSISSPSLGVLANDTDADGDALTANLISGPSHAAAFGLNANGTFWYRPAVGFSGLDTFTYRATDGENVGAVTTVEFTVNRSATIDYHALFWTIPEHQTLTAPLHVGTVGIIDDGIGINTVTLTGPDAGLFELDSGNNLFLKAGLTIDSLVQSQFDVTVNIDDPSIAGSPDSSQRLVFTIDNLNEAPTATALPDVVVFEDAIPGTISTAFAFSDPDGDALTYSVQVASQTPGLIRSISINQTTGSISYGLSADAFGTATLQVIARDPSNASVALQFQLIVQPVNDPPIVRNYAATTFSDEMLIVSGAGVLASATDAEFDAITVALVSAPVNGTVVLNASGGFVYTPNSGFLGVDTFRFVASDGSLSSNIGTATITVVPQFFGSQNGSTSGNSSSTSSSSTSSSPGTSSSSSGSSSTNSVASGTGNNGSKSPSTAGGAANSNSSGDPLLTGMINPALPGSTGLSSHNGDDDLIGVLPSVETTVVKRILPTSEQEEREDVDRKDTGDFIRRTSDNASVHDFDAAFAQLEAGDVQASLNREREILYRQIAEHVDSRSDSVTEELEKTAEFKGRVVGSVGVVTTGFSVGYLFWAVRLGTLASGLLAQVPAWSMLDPLLVIDGDQKDDDKESLQNIMDRQQAKLNKTEADGLQACHT